MYSPSGSVVKFLKKIIVANMDLIHFQNELHMLSQYETQKN